LSLKSTIDPEFHSLLMLSRSHFIAGVPPANAIVAHKLLLEECLGHILQPSVRGMFEETEITLK
jgi:hypothetical protein